MCEEWLKVHPEDRMPERAKPIAATESAKERVSEAKGTYLAWENKSASSTPPRPIADDVVRSMAESGTEIEIRAGESTIHVVPEHTDQDRLELTFREYAVVQSLLEVFPGSTFVSLTKKPKGQNQEATRKKVFEIRSTDELRERVSRLDPATGLERKDR